MEEHHDSANPMHIPGKPYADSCAHKKQRISGNSAALRAGRSLGARRYSPPGAALRHAPQRYISFTPLPGYLIQTTSRSLPPKSECGGGLPCWELTACLPGITC
jgi:hypothetical protein